MTIQVRELIELALKDKINLIPYGGGSSVVGHLTPPKRPTHPECGPGKAKPIIRSEHEENLEATFGAGVSGPELEAQLNKHGFTLGHFPPILGILHPGRMDRHPFGRAAILSLRPD
jgi:alkyldihydroxyacetonephosphate synthase